MISYNYHVAVSRERNNHVATSNKINVKSRMRLAFMICTRVLTLMPAAIGDQSVAEYLL